MTTLQCSVNRKLLPLKAHYFLYLAAQSSTLPYLAAAGRRKGIPETSIACIFAVIPFTAVFFKSLCGYIVDRSQRATVVLLSLQAIVFVSNGVVFLVNNSPVEAPHLRGLLKCPERNVTLLNESLNCTVSSALPCDTACGQEKKTSATTHTIAPPFFENITDMCMSANSFNSTASDSERRCEFVCPCFENVAKSSAVWLYAGFAAISWMATASVFVITDAAVCEVLGENASAFGRQRLWGTVSWGIVSPIVGVLIDISNSTTGGGGAYTWCFYALAFFLVQDMLVVFGMPRLRMSLPSTRFLKDVTKVFSSVEMLTFTFWTSMFGACMGATSSYSTWFLEDIGASKLIIGLTNAVMTLAMELPLLFLSKTILRHIGYFWSYSVSFAAFAVKFVGYSFLRDPWYALVVDFVGGAAFPLAIAAMTVFAREAAPRGTATSVLCILNASFEGIGMVIGNLVGGVSFGKYGGRLTFRCLGFAAAACAVGCALSHVAINKYSKVTASDADTEKTTAVTGDPPEDHGECCEITGTNGPVNL